MSAVGSCVLSELRAVRIHVEFFSHVAIFMDSGAPTVSILY